MTELTTYNPNDPDMLLARQFEEIRAGIIRASSGDSDLLRLLELSIEDEFELEESETLAGIWDTVQSTISSERKTAKILAFPNWKQWAVAASVLILSGIGIFISQKNTSDILLSTANEIASVTLADGSKVTLRPHSILHQSGDNSYTLSGEGYFDVAENPERIFSVIVGGSEINVLGTRFIAGDWGYSGSVYLESGSVEFVHLSTGKRVVLSPGEFSHITETGISEPVKSEASVHTDWIESMLKLESETIQIVFSELEQHFNISISAPASLYRERVSGTIQLASISQTLSDLGLVLGGKFTERSEGKYSFSYN